MEKIKFLLVVALASIALVAPNAVRADSVTEDISLSATVPVLGTVMTSQFAAFNTGLGTLVDMSVTLSGTLDYTGLGIPMDEGADLELQEDPIVSPNFCASGHDDCIFIPALGSGLPFTFTISGMTNPTVLFNYSGTGLRDFGVYDFGGNLTDHITFMGKGAVTFDYIPVKTPVAEPSITLMLICGLFALVSGVRAKRLV